MEPVGIHCAIAASRIFRDRVGSEWFLEGTYVSSLGYMMPASYSAVCACARWVGGLKRLTFSASSGLGLSLPGTSIRVLLLNTPVLYETEALVEGEVSLTLPLLQPFAAGGLCCRLFSSASRSPERFVGFASLGVRVKLGKAYSSNLVRRIYAPKSAWWMSML